jgi:NTP pyrophosphatase (non-canonical NTP hydrolase)
MQSKEEKAVLSFQQKVGAPAPMTLADAHKQDSAYPGVIAQLRNAAETMKAMSDAMKAMFRICENQMSLRGELLLEELAELLEAMADGDEIKSLDAIGDVLYVVYGTATQFRLPAASAFWEAHTSNMSKGSQAATHSGDKGKGAGFKEPRFDLVLMAHRAEEEDAANQLKIVFDGSEMMGIEAGREHA